MKKCQKLTCRFGNFFRMRGIPGIQIRELKQILHALGLLQKIGNQKLSSFPCYLNGKKYGSCGTSKC